MLGDFIHAAIETELGVRGNLVIPDEHDSVADLEQAACEVGDLAAEPINRDQTALLH